MKRRRRLLAVEVLPFYWGLPMPVVEDALALEAKGRRALVWWRSDRLAWETLA